VEDLVKPPFWGLEDKTKFSTKTASRRVNQVFGCQSSAQHEYSTHLNLLLSTLNEFSRWKSLRYTHVFCPHHRNSPLEELAAFHPANQAGQHMDLL